LVSPFQQQPPFLISWGELIKARKYTFLLTLHIFFSTAAAAAAATTTQLLYTLISIKKKTNFLLLFGDEKWLHLQVLEGFVCLVHVVVSRSLSSSLSI